MTTHQNRVPLFSLSSVDPVYRGGQAAKYTTTMTLGRLAELLASDQIMVDYDYQRGVKISYSKDGIEKRTPMVDLNRVDEIADKILSNQLFGGSLAWNLRREEVSWSYDMETRILHVFAGKPTIPDSNHRHQAIKKVAELVRTRGYNFDLNAYEFPLVIEVLDLNGERGLFYEYNQLGKPANPTRSRYINQADLHNSLTSQVVDSSTLQNHVELVSNNISRNSTKIATFNTLAKGIEEGFPEFPLVIEVLDLNGERGLFYEYNQLGKPANPTRSRYINQADLHNSLTSQVVDSSTLQNHVELVSNNISRNSTKIATFNTLAKGIEEGFPDLDEANYDETRQYLIDFFNHLATIRPEMGYLDISARKAIREKTIGDTALVVQAYVKMAGDFHETKSSDWAERLSNLAKPYTHTNGWSGDLMGRSNPLWIDGGVLTPTNSGAMSVTNRRQSKKYMHDSLRTIVGITGAEATPAGSPMDQSATYDP